MEIAHLSLSGSDTTIRFASRDTVFQFGGSRVDLVVGDANTVDLLPVEEDIPRITLPPGEACKDYKILGYLLSEFVRLDLRRDSVIAGVGGGAVTDVVAFAASVYLRGVTVILIPTSLLAMVDAAVGGKTGIDLEGYKNLVGTFYPATEVRILPELVATLSEREYRSGLAEVIKAAVLDDEELLRLLEDQTERVLAREPEVLTELILRAVRVKVAIVDRDFTEQGVRAHLNLGHTFGHALETCLGLGLWTHGEAVAWGIARAMDAGVLVGLTVPVWADRVRTLLERYHYPIYERPVSAEALVAAMDKDKKRRRQGVAFVLQRGPFETVQRTLNREILDTVLQAPGEARQ